MATDYEAVYESVMRYTRVSAQDIDTQDKLARYLRQNDNRNTMTDKLIDRLVETNNAKNDIEASKENNFEEVKKERRLIANENEQRVKTEKYELMKQGKKEKGTVTVKKDEKRHVIYANKQGKLVYYDDKVKRAREVKVDKNNNYVVGGRFAKA